MAEMFTVTAQRQTVDLGTDGRFRDVIEVSFTDTHDNHGTIRVPVSQYSPDTVRAMIQERVDAMHEIHEL